METPQEKTATLDGENDNNDDISNHSGNVGIPSPIDFTNVFATNKVFASKDELIEWLRMIGRRHGMVIIMKKSDLGQDGRRPRIEFACERHGCYTKKNKGNEGGKTKRPRTSIGTKKCGCPFLLKGKRLPNDDEWILKVICGVHNHPLDEQLAAGHSYAGRLTDKETEILVDMLKNNVKPKEILHKLKQQDECNVTTMKHIYNARHKHKAKLQADASYMQQLMLKLAEHSYVEWDRRDEESHCVKDLFWAHPSSVDLLRAFPDVLIVNRAHRTNKNSLPLLEIIGVTSTDMTFSVAFAYLQFEKEENYTWALGRLRSLIDGFTLPSVIVTERDLVLMSAVGKVFPRAANLLCRWNVSKDVSVNTRKYFEKKERWDAFNSMWNVVILSNSMELYNINLNAMVENSQNCSSAVEYVKNTWLTQYKEKFVVAWTNLCMHFGNTATNRMESAHAKLRRQLEISQINLEASWSKIHEMLEVQHNDIKASFEKSLSIDKHDFHPVELFKELVGFVSRSALNIILQESERAGYVGVDSVACGCVTRRTHGLPCAHEIGKYKQEGCPIPLSSIHAHWKKMDFLPSCEDNTWKSCTHSLSLLFNMISKCIEESDEDGRVQIIQQLKALTDSLLESTDVTCGHHPLKLDTSAEQDQSYSDYVTSSQDFYSSDTSNESGNPSARQVSMPKLEVFPLRPMKPTTYLEYFPIGLKPYIKDIKDVLADGNCGFRVVAELIGIGQQNWCQIRRDMLEELQCHFDEYCLLYGGVERVNELVTCLSHFKGNASCDHWMTMPDMGYLISSRYNVVLVHLSKEKCLTFLPLRSQPVPAASQRVLTLGFVRDNHFITVFMPYGSPMPPIECSWFKFHHECASGWATPYVKHIEVFRKIVSSNLDTTTSEAIHFDMDSS